jgi:ketosteroid isomerase-like protein
MPAPNRTDLARDVFTAFAAGDRERIEALLAPSLTFHAPPDPNLDRAGYFERCWPGSGNGSMFDFARMIESGDEVVVTHNATRKDGSRFRNTEVLTFEDDQVAEIEGYFGWDLEQRPAPGTRFGRRQAPRRVDSGELRSRSRLGS